jgi:alpha-L-fucosidase 2
MTRHVVLLLVAVSFAEKVGSAADIRSAIATGNLRSSSLPTVWDEGFPLGNGMLGALVWERNGRVRLALDRADLWDLRPVPELSRPEFSFRWVLGQVEREDYRPVQEMFDVPYDREATPTKLPGAALEFTLPAGKEVRSAELDLETATATVEWRNGMRAEMFVHAIEQSGWFRIDNAPRGLRPSIDPPPYASTKAAEGISGAGGNDLRRLGYPAPVIAKGVDSITYTQQCAGGMSYHVLIRWNSPENSSLIGCWTITTTNPYALAPAERELPVPDEISYAAARRTHLAWWWKFWSSSSLQVPDTVLQRQWYLEQYKFGSSARRHAPPISLQAVWTADNGRLPPWKGDFHNDLNTQLSYWPAYGANHLDEADGFLDWLWHNKPAFERYTRTFFGTSGLNVPGVATLTGEPMGGWIQYSFSPTVSAWLAQHFYLQWRYGLDTAFLRARAYPWLRGVAVHLDELAVRDPSGRRRLPLSSSPEINDNRLEAWFRQTTNYDLALIRWLYEKAGELADVLGEKADAERWERVFSEWPQLAVAADTSLLVAPGIPLRESHRHFSHLMAIHPLGLLQWTQGETDRRIIAASLEKLMQTGPSLWCGYSYSWLGNMWARARNGEKAAEALRTFATCFCLPNSFHANGDQSGTGKSSFTYRPFTLEGNFAFAAGLQEMLLQSQNALLQLFPAVPAEWSTVSFTGLRAEGAFLVSATRIGGKVDSLRIVSERGGRLRVENPFRGGVATVTGAAVTPETFRQPVIDLDTTPGSVITFVRKRP